MRAKKTTKEQGYSSRWRRARSRFLALHPLCMKCAKAGVVTIATDVHHIIHCEPHRPEFYDADNWMALCHSCHSRITAGEKQDYRTERVEGNRGPRTWEQIEADVMARTKAEQTAPKIVGQEWV